MQHAEGFTEKCIPRTLHCCWTKHSGAVESRSLCRLPTLTNKYYPKLLRLYFVGDGQHIVVAAYKKSGVWAVRRPANRIESGQWRNRQVPIKSSRTDQGRMPGLFWACGTKLPSYLRESHSYEIYLQAQNLFWKITQDCYILSRKVTVSTFG